MDVQILIELVQVLRELVDDMTDPRFHKCGGV